MNILGAVIRNTLISLMGEDCARCGHGKESHFLPEKPRLQIPQWCTQCGCETHVDANALTALWSRITLEFFNHEGLVKKEGQG